MIWKANAEIREALAMAAVARRRAESIRAPVASLDWVLARLEELNLARERVLPDSFVPLLRTICEQLPPHIERPHWGLSVREVMEQCFELQDQLLLPRPLRRRALQ